MKSLWAWIAVLGMLTLVTACEVKDDSKDKSQSFKSEGTKADPKDLTAKLVYNGQVGSKASFYCIGGLSGYNAATYSGGSYGVNVQIPDGSDSGFVRVDGYYDAEFTQSACESNEAQFQQSCDFSNLTGDTVYLKVARTGGNDDGAKYTVGISPSNDDSGECSGPVVINNPAISTDINAPSTATVGTAVGYSIGAGETGYLSLTTTASTPYGVYLADQSHSTSTSISLSAGYNQGGLLVSINGNGMTVANLVTTGFSSGTLTTVLVAVNNVNGSSDADFTVTAQSALAGGASYLSAAAVPLATATPIGGAYNTGFYSFTEAAGGTVGTLTFSELTTQVYVYVYDTTGTSQSGYFTSTSGSTTATFNVINLTASAPNYVWFYPASSSGTAVGNLTITTP